MGVDVVVQDAIKAASICVYRYPAAGLTRAGWIAGGVKQSLMHSREFALAGNPTGFASLVGKYVGALNNCGQGEAAAIVANAFQPTTKERT
ncbi:hypothetical protein [Achromobacter marplatensis]|uniref:hypothetical protein n=1 Tax=Achromobacter marplatensis TaxID=470868 RepID=UPI003C74524E